MNLIFDSKTSLYFSIDACRQLALFAVVLPDEQKTNKNSTDNIVDMDISIVSPTAMIMIGAWIEWHLLHDNSFPRLQSDTDRHSNASNFLSWQQQVSAWAAQKPNHVVQFETSWFDSCKILIESNTQHCGLLGDILCAVNYLECEPLCITIAHYVEKKLDSHADDIVSLLF